MDKVVQFLDGAMMLFIIMVIVAASMRALLI